MMGVMIQHCGVVSGPSDVTDVATDVEIIAPAEVRDYVAARGGRLYVWISMHRSFFLTLCLLETSLKRPTKGDPDFRRVKAEGFDVYLESTQRLWPRKMELALRRRRVEAYWNGLAYIA